MAKMTNNAQGAQTTQGVAVQEARTPENTPIPGGGRWRWDEALTDWVSLDEPAQVEVADQLPQA